MSKTSLIEELEERFESGDKTALLDCLCYCLNRNLEIPEWCRQGFVSTVFATRRFEFATWDEAFGKPHPKGTRVELKRLLGTQTRRVVKAIALYRSEGEKVDNDLFEQVAEGFGDMSRATVSRRYYRAKRIWDALPKEEKHKSRLSKMAFDGE